MSPKHHSLQVWQAVNIFLCVLQNLNVTPQADNVTVDHGISSPEDLQPDTRQAVIVLSCSSSTVMQMHTLPDATSGPMLQL